MGFPSACTANGRAWARVCTAPCTPNAQCRWYSLCDYIAGNRACSACIDGFADGNYFVGGFIDTDGNADPNNPAPDPGDISAAQCVPASVTNGGTAYANVTTQTCP